MQQRLSIAVIALGWTVAGGCASPPEFKAASTKQVELTKELPGSVADLSGALQTYLGQLDDLTLKSEKLRLAETLVVILAKSPAATHDEVMDRAAALDRALQSLVNKTVYEGLRDRAEADLVAAGGHPSTAPVAGESTTAKALRELVNELNSRIAEIRKSPLGLKKNLPHLSQEMFDSAAAAWGKVADRAAVEHKLVADDQVELSRELAFLTKQIAAMDSATATIDDWIQTDVTLTQDQADGLVTNLTDATDAVNDRKNRSKTLALPSAPTEDKQ